MSARYDTQMNIYFSDLHNEMARRNNQVHPCNSIKPTKLPWVRVTTQHVYCSELRSALMHFHPTALQNHRHGIRRPGWSCASPWWCSVSYDIESHRLFQFVWAVRTLISQSLAHKVSVNNYLIIYKTTLYALVSHNYQHISKTANLPKATTLIRQM